LNIAVEDIREGVSTLEFSCGPEEIGLEAENIRFIGPVVAKLRLFKQIDKVFIEAELTVSIEFGCARCLEPVEVILRGTSENQYRPLPKNAKETLDYIGIGYYSGDNIDLSENFRESILLELPAKVLCSENCRGLCPSCGENLNEGRCNCRLEPEEIRSSKFAELASFLKQKA